MNNALNRSCSGVDPVVFKSVDLSVSICAGVTCTDILSSVYRVYGIRDLHAEDRVES